VTDFDHYQGRYIYLLIRRFPNKPAWALKPGETVEWHAAAVARQDQPALLAFSSLPKAVAFMQPAVLSGLINDINKVAKFRRETARAWSTSLLLNPTADELSTGAVIMLPVDPETAETPDE
jgi:hypothetical protein